MEVSTVKLPYLFHKTMTKTNTKKRGSSLEVPMKDSRVCWAVGMRKELELVMKRPEDGKEEKWVVTWRSGRKKHRGDHILGGWHRFALHYKLVPNDVLAFTIITPSLVSVQLMDANRHYPSYPVLLPASSKNIPRTTEQNQLALEGGLLQLSNRGVAACSPPLLITEAKPLQCTPSQISSRALWYVKVKPDHLQGRLLLLDIPTEFAKQMAKRYWGCVSNGGQQHSLAHPTQKLVLDQHEIEEGDVCIFELNDTSTEAYPSCTSLIHVYVYKKDRGKPSILTITFTQ